MNILNLQGFIYPDPQRPQVEGLWLISGERGDGEKAPCGL